LKISLPAIRLIGSVAVPIDVVAADEFPFQRCDAKRSNYADDRLQGMQIAGTSRESLSLNHCWWRLRLAAARSSRDHEEKLSIQFNVHYGT